MYRGFDYTVKEDVIVLCHLKTIYESPFRNLFHSYEESWEKNHKYKNKTEEEIEKELYDEKEKLSKESLEKYYKIEKGKDKELEKIFKSFKSKIHYRGLNYLDKGKFWSLSNNLFTMFDSVTFKKIYEIKFNEKERVKSVIELDNNDLVFMIEFDFYSGKSQYASYLFIYRLQNEKYILFQKIKEDQTGYETQKSFSGCFQHSKSFELNKIKKLSYNKIMSISNYGIRIYALDKKKEYSMVLMDIHSEGLEQIYEIDEKNLIFCTKIHYGDSLGSPAHDFLKIEKVNLIKITNKDLTNNNKKEHDLDKKEESKRTVSSSKLISFCWEVLEYSTHGGYHYFSNLIILKQKYFIIMIDYYLLVFDLSTGNQLARYKIAKKGEKKLYYDKFNKIEKWNNINDNEFFINKGGYITLFELDDTNGITLKIIAYSYFPNIRNLNKIENQNSFYNQEEDHILIY